MHTAQLLVWFSKPLLQSARYVDDGPPFPVPHRWHFDSTVTVPCGDVVAAGRG